MSEPQQQEITAVILKPRERFYAWVADIASSLNSSQSVDIHNIALGSTVLMIPHGHSSTAFTLYLMEHLNAILTHEFLRWTPDKALWPLRFDYDLLMQYFDLEIHTTVLDYNIRNHSNQGNHAQHFRQIIQDIKKKSILVVKPKTPVHAWLKQVYSDTLEALSIQQLDFSLLERDSTVYVLPCSLDSTSKNTAFLKKNAMTIFEFELEQLITDKQYWPENRTFDLFSQWFGFEIHSHISTC